MLILSCFLDFLHAIVLQENIWG